MKIVHSSGRAFLQPIFVVKAAEYWNGNNAVIIRNVVPLDLRLNPSIGELRNSQFRSRIGTTVPTSPHLPEVRGL
jgi:hypothetical protein